MHEASSVGSGGIHGRDLHLRHRGGKIPGAPAPPNASVASSVVLRDHAGHIRGFLSVGEDGSPVLAFLDSKQTERTRIGISTDAQPCIWLSDERGKERI